MINFAEQQKITQFCKSAMLLCCLAAKSCLTLWDYIYCSLPGSSVEFPRQEHWNDFAFPSYLIPAQWSSPHLLLCSSIFTTPEGIVITVHYLNPAKGLTWLEHRNWFKLRDEQKWHDHLSRLLSLWSPLQAVSKSCTEHAQDIVASG